MPPAITSTELMKLDARLLSVEDWKDHCNQGCPVCDWQDTGTTTKLMTYWKYYMLCTPLLYFLQDHIHQLTQTCHGWSLKVYGACVHVDGFCDAHWGVRFCIAITVDSVENGVWFSKASGIGKKRSIDYEDVTKWTLISLLLVAISIGCNFLLV